MGCPDFSLLRDGLAAFKVASDHVARQGERARAIIQRELVMQSRPIGILRGSV